MRSKFFIFDKLGNKITLIKYLAEEVFYMLQPNILSVITLHDYRLLLTYETGEKKIFDVKPYINGEWYSELLDVHYFKTVHVIGNGYGIEWDNGQDIAPHELYELSISVN